jgi:quinol-cytochrome oxidoreductase complex cytochrome b subunit
MDHKEQHHQHHQHEREEKKKEQKEYEHAQEKNLLPFHPAWLFGVGVALVVAALLIWTFLLQ